MLQPWFQRPLYRAIFFVLFGIFVVYQSNGDALVVAGGIFLALAGIGLNYLAWQTQQKAEKDEQPKTG